MLVAPHDASILPSGGPAISHLCTSSPKLTALALKRIYIESSDIHRLSETFLGNQLQSLHVSILNKSGSEAIFQDCSFNKLKALHLTYSDLKERDTGSLASCSWLSSLTSLRLQTKGVALNATQLKAILEPLKTSRLREMILSLDRSASLALRTADLSHLVTLALDNVLNPEILLESICKAKLPSLYMLCLTGAIKYGQPKPAFSHLSYLHGDHVLAPLQELRIHGIALQVGAAHRVRHFIGYLEKLYLTRADIDDEVMEQLFTVPKDSDESDWLDDNGSYGLSELILDDNPFQALGMAQLVAFSAYLSHITTLSLKQGSYGKLGMRILLAGLQNNVWPSLELLCCDMKADIAAVLNSDWLNVKNIEAGKRLTMAEQQLLIEAFPNTNLKFY